MKSFDGKVAAITGAASGMGRSLAIALAKRRCEVALSDIDERGLAETKEMIRGVRVTTKRVDVSKVDEVQGWANEVASTHGRVNLIFNNAGMSYAATAKGGELHEIERVIDIDYWGVVHGTRAFLPYLEASGDGHVINTSSVFGLIGFPGQTPYCSAKFAVRGYTEALRIELEIMRSCVSATCVHPGGIKTNIARSARYHHSLSDLGMVDLENAGRRFERAFRTTAEDAAEQILRGVTRNDRRLLIGADARFIDAMQRLFPNRYHALIARTTRFVSARDRKAYEKENVTNGAAPPRPPRAENTVN